MKESICAICKKPFPEYELTEFDENLFCSSCLVEQTVLCQDCGKRLYRSQNEGTAEYPLCISCHDDNYTYCERCGRMIHNDAAHYLDDSNYPYCRSCYEIELDTSIHEYGYKPEPIFFGNGKRFFGVELEIDEGGEDASSAEAIMFVANRSDERVYCKHDGSINDGFEIVTHPMTLKYHIDEMPWESFLNKAKAMGYNSHQSGTCGLHIHVNRISLGENDIARDACIARSLYLFEKFWDELLKFSRRTHRQLERWASRYGYKDSPQDILDHAKKGTPSGRYTCVNLENRDTIEFRIFRGTLKLNTIIATLQLVDRVCDVALYLSDDEVKSMSWTTFVAGCTAPELVQYLKERRLYINEPVECEEDI